jgi:glycosyltransferase involved in cell wall biosynthesis
MKQFKVSIIIPAYNEEARLKACLESIKRLHYPSEHLETIVVDNGSTDKTKSIAREFGAVVLEDKTKNVSGLRNLGAEASHGEILAFVDADCAVDENWVLNASPYFSRNDIAAWGAPPVPPVDSTWVQRTWFLVRQKPGVVQEVPWLESMNLWVRKADFIALGGFTESLVTCEDVDFSYRIRVRGMLLSDSRIKVIHYGEAADLRTFIKKETWRGSSNLRAIRNYGLKLREIPSLILPAYFALIVPASIVLQPFLRRPAWLLLPFILLFMPSFAALFKLRGKPMNMLDRARLIFLLQVYFMSRSFALLKR